MLAPQVIEPLRLRGNKNIVPDLQAMLEIGETIRREARGTFRFCVHATGNVEAIRTVHSTGYASYDRRILAELEHWAYKPYLVDGKPMRVCSTVTFIYRNAMH